MTNVPLEHWDRGQLIVHRDFVPLLTSLGWLTFEDIWTASQQAEVAKQLRAERVTVRLPIVAPDGRSQAVYLKRHTASDWWEYLKPLLQGRKPTIGARVEWDALLGFHADRLPTMTPMAMGHSGTRQFLLTAALEPSRKLSDLLPGSTAAERREWSRQVAQLASRMHAAGWHHQDFYLGHLLLDSSEPAQVHVIDLGRVQRHVSWTARRWIIKDLAQLNYSARALSSAERMRFLRDYLGRPFQPHDRSLIRGIIRKTARISAHSRKHGL